MNKDTSAWFLEHLMVYGWAYIIVIVSVGALFYFGVLNVSPIKEECCERICCGLDSTCSEYGMFPDLDGYTIICDNSKRIAGMTFGQALEVCSLR